jgi:hypothetical protein
MEIGGDWSRMSYSLQQIAANPWNSDSWNPRKNTGWKLNTPPRTKCGADFSQGIPKQ